jgi:large subunit ribosomal protein L3
MCKTIIAKKIGMTQVWSEDEKLIACTVLEAGPCPVVQIKTTEHDGYNALQLGFGTKKANRVNKPTQGHFAKAEVEPTRVLQEVRVDSTDDYKLGQEITVADLAEAKKVNVSGVSKGKGFAGVMRRYNFGGGPGGHGHHFHRAPGSVGMCATPSRVLKGLRLPGHMGVDNVTIRNLDVLRVEPDQNLILVKGAVPGGKGAFVTISQAA